MILDLFRKGVEFYNIQGYDDLKDIIKRVLHGKLVRKNDGPEEVEQILSTMIKYGNERALN